MRYLAALTLAFLLIFWGMLAYYAKTPPAKLGLDIIYNKEPK